MSYHFSINQGRSRVDPQKAYKWVAQFPVDFGSLSDPLNVERFSIPLPNYNAEPSYSAGANVYYPSNRDIEGFSATLYLSEDAGVLEDIMRWKSLIQNPDGTFNYPDEYKFPVTALLLSGDNVEVARFQYNGVFPTQTQTPELDYATSERVLMAQSFSADEVQISVNGSIFGSGGPFSTVRRMLTKAVNSQIGQLTGNTQLGQMAASRIRRGLFG